MRLGCSSPFESKIDRAFVGWDGDTIFKVKSGQVWQQVSFDYEYQHECCSEVVIFSFPGGCNMHVEGMDEATKVKLFAELCRPANWIGAA